MILQYICGLESIESLTFTSLLIMKFRYLISNIAVAILLSANNIYSHEVEAQYLSMQSEIEDYIDKSRAEVGVAVIIGDKDTVVVNNGRYPMNSVLKLYQLLPTARALSERHMLLDSVVSVSRGDLDPDTWSPMLNDHPTDTVIETTYRKLMEYAVGQSDNNACDVLFDRVCPIADVVDFWRDKGIDGFNISWNEAEMHACPSLSNDNWTTPQAAAEVIAYMMPYSLYSSDYNISQVSGFLTGCLTGVNRIPKPLARSGAIIAHKTGTGFNDADGFPTGINDVAYIILPDGRHYTLAVFVKTSRRDIKGTEQIIADISEIVYRYCL